jgi:murein DD-endopeptidase MepM/ murein hydrolase activator NlpD
VFIGRLTLIQSVFVFLTISIMVSDYNDEISLPEAATQAARDAVLIPSSIEPVASNFVPSSEIPTLERVEAIKFVQHTVAPGETLETILQAYRVAGEHARVLARNFFESPKQARYLKAGETIELVHSALTKKVVGLKRDTGDGGYLLLSYMPDQGLIKESVEGHILEEERTVSGTITSSFAKSAADAQLPYEIVDDFVDIFADAVEFRRDLHRGDSFSLIYRDRRDQNGIQVGSGPILAASLRTGGKMLVAIRYVGKDNQPRYFDAQGQPRGSAFLRYPLKFTRISSVFSQSRFHPVLKSRHPHNGVDFAAPTGTPVRSIGAGLITYAGWKGPNGILVKIQHSARYSTAYVHLSRLAKGIRKGVRVRRGQEVGAVGSTGRATGPHLHFSLYDFGKFVDPLKTNLPMVVDKDNMIPKGVLLAQVRALREQHRSIAVAQATAKGSTVDG